MILFVTYQKHKVNIFVYSRIILGDLVWLLNNSAETY